MTKWLTLVTLVPSMLVSAGEFPSVEDLMTREEFELTGMAKLSEDELSNLRVWLQVYTERDAGFLKNNASKIDAQVGEGKLAINSDIRSTIEGDFTGWTGKTKFTLASGQVWQQRADGRLRTKAINPQVIIRKNLLGFYEMEVPLVKKKVLVKRIE